MNSENFTYRFTTPKTPAEVFAYLLNPNNWWTGVYGETIQGKSQALNDEFSFRAGQGMHHTVQKLIELIPNQKITWLVSHSELTFLAHPDEWKNTQINFEIQSKEHQTQVTFTHRGLVAEIECYDNCSKGWRLYMQNLEKTFQ